MTQQDTSLSIEESIEEDNERMIKEAEAKAKLRKCDFCGLDENHCETLIAGICAFICGRCTQLCADIVLKHLYDKATRLQTTIKDIEKHGGIPAVAGVSDQEIPSGEKP